MNTETQEQHLDVLFGDGAPKKMTAHDRARTDGLYNCGKLAKVYNDAEKGSGAKDQARDLYIDQGCHMINGAATYPLFVSDSDIRRLNEIVVNLELANANTEEPDMRARTFAAITEVKACLSARYDAGSPQERQKMVGVAKKYLGIVLFDEPPFDEGTAKEEKEECQTINQDGIGQSVQITPQATLESQQPALEAQTEPKKRTRRTKAEIEAAKTADRQEKLSSEQQDVESSESFKPKSNEEPKKSASISDLSPTKPESQDFALLPGDKEVWVDPRTLERYAKPVTDRWRNEETGEVLTQREMDLLIESETGVSPGFSIHDQLSADWYLKKCNELEHDQRKINDEIELVTTQLQALLKQEQRKLARLQSRYDWQLRSWIISQLPRNKDGSFAAKKLILKHGTVSFRAAQPGWRVTDRYKMESRIKQMTPAEMMNWGVTIEMKPAVKFKTEDIVSRVKTGDELGEGLFTYKVEDSVGTMSIGQEKPVNLELAKKLGQDNESAT